LILLALVEVDGLLMDQDRRGLAIELADHPRRRALLDDDEVVDRRRPQADRLGREVLGHPVIASAAAVQDGLSFEEVQNLAAAGRASELRAFLPERQLEGGAAEVIGQDREVVWIDQAALRRLAEEV